MQKDSWRNVPVLRAFNSDEKLLVDDNFTPEIEGEVTRRLLENAIIFHHCPCDPNNIVTTNTTHCAMINAPNFEQISTFICEHNLMRGGNITRMSPKGVENFMQSGFHRADILSNNGLILGVIFTKSTHVKYISYISDISQSPSEIVEFDTGCTTFMVVHKSFRGMGMAMALIKQAIKIGIPHNVKSGYHLIDREIGVNCLELNMWFRPIDVQRTLDTNHPIPTPKNLILNRKDKLKWLNEIYRPYIESDFAGYEIRNATDDPEIVASFLRREDFNFEKDANSQALWWTPSKDEVSRMCKTFHTRYMVERANKDRIVGCFVLYEMEIQIDPLKKSSSDSLTCAGWSSFFRFESPELLLIGLKYMVEYARQLGLPYLLFHEVGSLNEGVLKTIKAIKSQGKNILGYYNVGVWPDSSRISLPLL